MDVVEFTSSVCLLLCLDVKDERDDLLKDLTEKKSLHAKLLSELEEYKSCDPEHVESLSEPFIIKKPLVILSASLQGLLIEGYSGSFGLPSWSDHACVPV